MKPHSSKAKGRRCAQAVKTILLEAAVDLRKDDIIVTPSGVTGPDLILSPRAKERFPMATECKNCEKISIWEALDQAKSHASGQNIGLEPILFFKRNRSELYAAVDAQFLIELIAAQTKPQGTIGF
jgi:hypothetical protein